jgi:small redox-active disulfide protein 1
MTKIEIFTSPTCPHCPHAKRIAMAVAKTREVKVIETSTYNKEGQKRANHYNIRSVPTLFITSPEIPDRIAFAGVPSENQLNRMLDIAEGKENWPEKKEGLFSRIAKKLKIKIKI